MRDKRSVFIGVTIILLIKYKIESPQGGLKQFMRALMKNVDLLTCEGSGFEGF